DRRVVGCGVRLVVKIVVAEFAGIGCGSSHDDLHDRRIRPEVTRRSSRPTGFGRGSHDDLHDPPTQPSGGGLFTLPARGVSGKVSRRGATPANAARTTGLPSSWTPAARTSTSARGVVWLDTPAVRSSSTRELKPARAASMEVARTQWSVAIPTTSTSVTPRERSHSSRLDPSWHRPSKPA